MNHVLNWKVTNESERDNKMTLDRRRFLGGAAMTIVADQLGMVGSAKAQSSEET